MRISSLDELTARAQKLPSSHMAVVARVPIVINSRADDAATRLRSVAMAALVAS